MTWLAWVGKTVDNTDRWEEGQTPVPFLAENLVECQYQQTSFYPYQKNTFPSPPKSTNNLEALVSAYIAASKRRKGFCLTQIQWQWWTHASRMSYFFQTCNKYMEASHVES